MLPALAAHIEVMAQARESGELRTIVGHAYPVPAPELARWQAQKQLARQEQVKRFLRSKMGARLEAESAFA